MTGLSRLTTEYIPHEDRLRLSGELDDGSVQVLWLTQRLLQRLVPVLVEWLEQRDADTPRGDLLQAFRQQSAHAALEPQPAVRADSSGMEWLVSSVNINRSEGQIRLTFTSPDGREASVALAARPLRQWLTILYGGYRKAQWPLDIWPEWMMESAQPQCRVGVVH